MSQSAYIKLVEGSAVSSLTLEEVKEHLHTYVSQTSLTGQQLDWEYAEASFPYTIETKPEGEGKWFYLKGKDEQKKYKYLIFGVGTERDGEKETCYIQVVLPDGSTHGDKSKGNEYCKYLAKKLQAELHLFNGRVMYFNPRK